MKNIGILTFHASHNYGSMLQAWALQKYLTNNGFNVKGINLRTIQQKRMFPNPLGHCGPNVFLQFTKHPTQFIRNTKKWYRFENFLKKHLKLSPEYNSWEDIIQNLPNFQFDAIVCGGDQIWNTTCIDFDKSYYLPSKLDKIKKISYSPSMGGFLNKFSDIQSIEFIKQQLTDFDFISVREKETSLFLKSLLNRPIIDVPDPTLLLKKEEYNSLISKKPIIKGEYILYYTPYCVPEAENIAFKLSKYYQKPLVITNKISQAPPPNAILYTTAGPKEFLNILKNAFFVCGQSFHLIVFSLLFHKEFIAINGDSDTRMSNLLTYCNLKERAVSLTNPIIKNYDNINYEVTDLLLQNIRQKGINYINTWF